MDVKKVILLPLLTVVATFTALVGINAASKPVVTYSAHVQNIGWMDAVTASNSKDTAVIAGTEGQSLRVEALKINVSGVEDVDITYRAHVQNIGWMDAVSAGELAGTEGQSLRVEAIEINEDGLEDLGYVLKYRVHVQNIGWMDWKSAGEIAGTEGQGLRVEAIQIVLQKEEDALKEAQKAAKAELKDFAKSGPFADKYVKQGMAAELAKATTADGAYVLAIEAAATVEDVADVVEDSKENLIDALRDYYKAELNNYANNAVYEFDEVKYALDEDVCDDAIDALYDAEDEITLADIYNDAMAQRVNYTELVKAAQDRYKSFVKQIKSEYLNNRVKYYDMGAGKVAKDGHKYYEVKPMGGVNTIPAITSGDNVITAGEAAIDGLEIAATYDAEVFEETIDEAIKNVFEATQEFARKTIAKVVADAAYTIDDDYYFDYQDAIDDAKSEAEVIRLYEDALTKIEIVAEKDFNELREDLIEELNEILEEDYTINASEAKAEFDRIINKINRVKFSATAVDDLKDLVTFTLDAQDKLDDVVIDTATPVSELDNRLARYDIFTDNEVEAKVAEKSAALDTYYANLNTYTVPGDATSDKYKEVAAIEKIYDTAKDALDDEKITVKAADKVLENAKKDIFAATKAYVATQIDDLYNNNKKASINGEEYYWDIDKAGYRAVRSSVTDMTNIDNIALVTKVYKDAFTSADVDPWLGVVTGLAAPYEEITQEGDEEIAKRDANVKFYDADGIATTAPANYRAAVMDYKTSLPTVAELIDTLEGLNTVKEVETSVENANETLIKATRDYLTQLITNYIKFLGDTDADKTAAAKDAKLALKAETTFRGLVNVYESLYEPAG